jgi:hypothetical protein
MIQDMATLLAQVQSTNPPLLTQEEVDQVKESKIEKISLKQKEAESFNFANAGSSLSPLGQEVKRVMDTLDSVKEKIKDKDFMNPKTDVSDILENTAKSSSGLRFKE